MNGVPIGAGIPRAGSALSRGLGRAILALAGWKIEGRVPDVAQLVICIAPHTSNWDFVIGYAAKLALGLRAGWLGKHTLFRGPLGPPMRRMGGIPVDRRAAHGVVAQVVARFAEGGPLLLAVAPEGTRRRVDHWKTGFYHIACEAGVPIWPVALDWGARVVRLGDLFVPGEDESADIAALQSWFRRARGRIPSNAFPPPGS
ncbi:MAG: lysophospholipid acyltransferase family protein [Gemmatimonadetes bacterium]|nr:lysophospholipid acyltransferase family protein [Gemmatimonadota bacterium]